MRRPSGIILFICLSFCVSAQQAAKQLQLPANRTTQPVKIDGLLSDSAWKDAAIMTDLIEFRPKIGDKEDPANRTIAYLMYNDVGIYFGGYCYERSRDSI